MKPTTLYERMTALARQGDGMHRGAVLAFPDDQDEPQCRLVLERIKWTPHLDYAGEPMRPGEFRDRPLTAAWLMCNPSRASHLMDDPTAGRVVHHSDRAGCARSLVGNVWPYRTPYPVDLWAAIAAGRVTEAMMQANLDALTMIGAQADIHVVAFGCAAAERDKVAVGRALEAFSLGHTVPLYCLGVSSGQPLHPLARGKFAVRNDTPLQLWRDVSPVRSWDDVFSDKVRVAGGWVDQ